MLTTAEKCNNTTVRCNSSLWLVGQKTNRLVQRYYTLLDALGLNAKRRCRRCLVRRSYTASPRVRLATFVITPHTHYGRPIHCMCLRRSAGSACYDVVTGGGCSVAVKYLYVVFDAETARKDEQLMSLLRLRPTGLVNATSEHRQNDRRVHTDSQIDRQTALIA